MMQNELKPCPVPGNPSDEKVQIRLNGGDWQDSPTVINVGPEVVSLEIKVGKINWRTAPTTDGTPGVNCPDCGGRIPTSCPHCGAMPITFENLFATYRAEIAQLRDKLARAREALVQHNERLRSALAVAQRDGRDTNWLAFRGQCQFTLAEYHDLVNEARQALKDTAHD